MKPIDICLLLEGTYPYVRGGVSSWVHQLISGLPQFNFYLVFIGGSKETYGEQYYTFPDNVVGIEKHYLMDNDGLFSPRPRRGKRAAFDMWQSVLERFKRPQESLSGEHLQGLLANLGKNKSLSYDDFLYSERSWEVIVDLYFKHAQYQSFVDYFWTFRHIYSPLFTLVKIAEKLPQARMYHSISTGYAGFLGALAKQKQNVPYLLTEHGIYTKERKIDLTQASWIKTDTAHSIPVSTKKWSKLGKLGLISSSNLGVRHTTKPTTSLRYMRVIVKDKFTMVRQKKKQVSL